MVVDAIDLCYSKSHIDMFALLSGDSDFSPLVSKLKENDKRVHRLRRAQLDVGSARRQLRRVHLLRRPDPRAEAHADAPQHARRRRAATGPTTTSSRRRSTGCVATVTSLETDYDPVWGSLVKQTMQARLSGLQRELLRLPDLRRAARGRGEGRRDRRSSSTSSAATTASRPRTDAPLSRPRPRRFDTSVTAARRRRRAETTASPRMVEAGSARCHSRARKRSRTACK